MLLTSFVKMKKPPSLPVEIAGHPVHPVIVVRATANTPNSSFLIRDTLAIDMEPPSLIDDLNPKLKQDRFSFVSKIYFRALSKMC